MIKKIKHIIMACLITSLLALSITGCNLPSELEAKAKITYVTEYGTAPEAVEVSLGDKLTSKELPTLDKVDGYDFIGWSLDGKTKIEANSVNVTKNLTLTAIWKAWDTVNVVIFTPDTSDVVKGTKVTLSCETVGATIYYTTDGTNPLANGKIYSNPIEITKDTTIKALATKKNTNASKVVTKTYTLKKAKINAVTFNQHNILLNEKLTITVKGENFDVYEKEKSTIKVALYYNSKPYGDPIVAKIDSEKNIAVAEKIIDSLPDEDGKIFYAKVLLNDKEVNNVTEAKIEPVYLTYPLELPNCDFDTTQGQNIKIRYINQTNFKFAESVTAQLFDKDNNKVGEPMDAKNGGINILVPTNIGQYTIKFFINDVEQKYTYDGEIQDIINPVINVLPAPTLESIEFPKAGTKAAGKSIIGFIHGKNFVQTTKFTVTSDNKEMVTDTKVTCVNKNKCKVEVKIPANEGTYNIKVSLGNYSKEGQLVVGNYDNYHIGDLVANDGKIYNMNDSNSNTTPIAIVAGFTAYGIPYGLGLERSNESLKFGKSYIPIENNRAKAPLNTKINDATEITGDLIGKDNWQEICLIDSEGTKNPAINYPAFDYANNYGKKCNITTGEYATGWYIPSCYELLSIMQNKSTIENTLKSLSKADDYFLGNFWSSNEYDDGTYFNVIAVKSQTKQFTKSNKIYEESYVMCIHDLQ